MSLNFKLRFKFQIFKFINFYIYYFFFSVCVLYFSRDIGVLTFNEMAIAVRKSAIVAGKYKVPLWVKLLLCPRVSPLLSRKKPIG